jgi:hypothetical protein
MAADHRLGRPQVPPLRRPARRLRPRPLPGLPTTDYRLPNAPCPLPPAHYRLPTADCRLTPIQILRRCGLWEGPLRTLANARGAPARTPQLPDEPRDLELVLDPEFLAAEVRQSDTHRSRELQLVLEERVPVRPTSEPDRRGFS